MSGLDPQQRGEVAQAAIDKARELAVFKGWLQLQRRLARNRRFLICSLWFNVVFNLAMLSLPAALGLLGGFSAFMLMIRFGTMELLDLEFPRAPSLASGRSRAAAAPRPRTWSSRLRRCAALAISSIAFWRNE